MPSGEWWIPIMIHVAPLTDNPRGVIYDRNMFIVQATCLKTFFLITEGGTIYESEYLSLIIFALSYISGHDQRPAWEQGRLRCSTRVGSGFDWELKTSLRNIEINTDFSFITLGIGTVACTIKVLWL
jgi:hypothetical protein